MNAVVRYIAERYAFRITLPLAGVLVLGLMEVSEQGMLLSVLHAFVITWLSLFALRATDDLHAITEDRMSRPQRGLSSGVISPQAVQRSVWYALAVIVIVSLYTLPLFGMVIACMMYYAIWFRVQEQMPYVLRPFGSNVVFVFLPVYISWLYTDTFSLSSVAAGGWIYGAAIAHEYAHNIGQRRPEPLPSYEKLMGTAKTTGMASLLFLMSCLSGMSYGYVSEDSSILLLILILHYLINQALLLTMLRHPSTTRVRLFYVLGYTFFLLPLLARAVTMLVMS
ncbi:hypothetical protein [Marinicrinis sediminis]|uniref:Ubiquinone biosynthesis protein UbiA n=1 Tax=Marinicrinis sediminis TaxID=1652465 RepID=A0ABW5RBQ7_9BACL